jgi:hypothetical protein
LSNSYAPKYGSLPKSLQSGYALKRNESPTNIDTAKSILDSHKWDPADWKSKSNRKNDKKQFSKRDDVKSQSRNSTERMQDVPQEVETMHTQIEGRCYCCGEKGHVSPDCPKKLKPKSEWYFNKLNKGQQHHQQNKANQNGTSTSNKTTNEDLFAQINPDMRNWILLDNQSTVDYFCNPHLLENIRDTSENYIVGCINNFCEWNN